MTYLVLPPLIVLSIALWKLWEPDRVPSFRLVLLAVLLQGIYLASLFVTHGAIVSWASGSAGMAAMVFMLHKTLHAEQIQKRIDEHRKDRPWGH